ncbi:unnamed protein product, partial [Ectocarpus sp. 12 AP-2014]
MTVLLTNTVLICFWSGNHCGSGNNHLRTSNFPPPGSSRARKRLHREPMSPMYAIISTWSSLAAASIALWLMTHPCSTTSSNKSSLPSSDALRGTCSDIGISFSKYSTMFP